MTASDATRLSLLSRARQHDSQAWSDLVELYGPLVAHWAYRCRLNSHQAADIVQEVFASVSRALEKYESRKENGAFRSWLWTITSNKVKDLHRRNQSLPPAMGGSTALADFQQIADSESFPDAEPTGDQQLKELVHRGLEQVRGEFEPRTWDIFRRTVVDEIATSIVAQEFCVSPAAVRQVRSRVLRRLRQQLGDVDED